MGVCQKCALAVIEPCKTEFYIELYKYTFKKTEDGEWIDDGSEVLVKSYGRCGDSQLEEDLARLMKADTAADHKVFYVQRTGLRMAEEK